MCPTRPTPPISWMTEPYQPPSDSLPVIVDSTERLPFHPWVPTPQRFKDRLSTLIPGDPLSVLPIGRKTALLPSLYLQTQKQPTDAQDSTFWVWDKHGFFYRDSTGGFQTTPRQGALLFVNGNALTGPCTLFPGDLVGFPNGAQLCFCPPNQCHPVQPVLRSNEDVISSALRTMIPWELLLKAVQRYIKKGIAPNYQDFYQHLAHPQPAFSANPEQAVTEMPAEANEHDHACVLDHYLAQKAKRLFGDNQSLINGWYWSQYGRHSMDSPPKENTGRIYFSLNPSHAVQAFFFLDRLLKGLAKQGIGVSAKTLFEKKTLDRPDGCVLYFDACDQIPVLKTVDFFFETAQLVAQRAVKKQGGSHDAMSWVKGCLPPLTVPLCDRQGKPMMGVSFGQEPVNLTGAKKRFSFNAYRAHAFSVCVPLIGEYIKKHGFQKKGIEALLVQVLRESGVDPEYPAFNLPQKGERFGGVENFFAVFERTEWGRKP